MIGRRDQNFRNRGISVYVMKLTDASAWCCREFTTGRISIFASLPQRSLGFGSQTFRGIHVGADTSSWQKAIHVLLADKLVEALTLRRLLKGALQGANLRSAFFVAAILIYQHELPINR